MSIGAHPKHVIPGTVKMPIPHTSSIMVTINQLRRNIKRFIVGRRGRKEHLLRHSGELEHVQRLVVHGGTLVDVDDHAGSAPAQEKAL